jgi:hypothetical protein
VWQDNYSRFVRRQRFRAFIGVVLAGALATVIGTFGVQALNSIWRDDCSAYFESICAVLREPELSDEKNLGSVGGDSVADAEAADVAVARNAKSSPSARESEPTAIPANAVWMFLGDYATSWTGRSLDHPPNSSPAALQGFTFTVIYPTNFRDAPYEYDPLGSGKCQPLKTGNIVGFNDIGDRVLVHRVAITGRCTQVWAAVSRL